MILSKSDKHSKHGVGTNLLKKNSFIEKDYICMIRVHETCAWAIFAWDICAWDIRLKYSANAKSIRCLYWITMSAN